MNVRREETRRRFDARVERRLSFFVIATRACPVR